MPRIDLLLHDTGVEGLNEFTPAAEIGRVLGALAEKTRTLDALNRDLVAMEASRLMRGNKVPWASRLLNTALRSADAHAAAASAGRPVLSDEIDPWPEPVDGAALLGELVATLRAHVCMVPAAIDAAALWILHSHTLDAAQHTPRLAFLSPVMRCGKTTALSLLGALVARALPTANITSAVLFRAVEAYRPTLLIDEADAFARDNEELRGVLNAGHVRDGVVLRCVGDDHEPRAFSVWAPVAIAAIGSLPNTLLDRSIIVRMRRLARGEAVRKLRRCERDALRPLRRRCVRWAADNIDSLRHMEPAPPDGLHDRAADNWEALLAIADAAGSEWPQRARAAASALSAPGVHDADVEDLGVELLADVRRVLDKREIDRMSMRHLADALVALDDRPWATVRHGQPLNANGLGHRLRAFGVCAVSIRSGGDVAKGYQRSAFADAFARYLPAHGGKPVTSVTGTESAANFGLEAELLNGDVTESPTRLKRSDLRRVTDVTGGRELTAEDRGERAAIYEYDGGLPREEAERRAGLH